MQKLEYVGPFQGEVQVFLASGGVTVTQQQQLEVSDEDAASLLEQPDNWQPAKAASSKKGA